LVNALNGDERDFIVAIQEGATMVRIGTAILGSAQSELEKKEYGPGVDHPHPFYRNDSTWLLIAYVVLSYFMSPYHPVRQTVDRIVEPC
jgi:hypothetical protein